MSQRTCVIVPSRGRPGNVRRLITAWHDTGATARLVVGLDDDDEYLDAYLDACKELDTGDVWVGERLRMNGTLNSIVHRIHGPHDVIGFMGDDHLPVTPGWDDRIESAIDDLDGVGIVYGDDGIQGPNLPTAVFMSASIVEALGYMAPPVLTHLFLDNYWRDLGRASGRLRYLPDVKISHLHPLAGKADDDLTYQEANSGLMWETDQAAYEKFGIDGGIIADATKIRGLL